MPFSIYPDNRYRVSGTRRPGPGTILRRETLFSRGNWRPHGRAGGCNCRFVQGVQLKWENIGTLRG